VHSEIYDFSFQIFYNYEVSIYEELVGSNNWNGSVLSIMLLAGSGGALLPIWLRTGEITLFKRSFYLSLAEVIAAVTLLFSVFLWETIATISMLTIFFAAWQFINVVFYSQLAIGLKETSIRRMLPERKSQSSFNSHQQQEKEAEPPYSVGIVTIIAVCVLLQILLQSVLLSGLQFNLKDAMWIASLIFLAATGGHLCFTAIAIHT